MTTGRLFLIGFICAILGVGLVVHNRAIAQNQAASLLQADTAGTDVTQQLASLKQYVGAHMGTSVNFVLRGSYNRQLEQAQAASQPQPSGDVYQQAQAACAGIKNAVQQAQCNQNYLNTHLQAAAPSPVVAPSQAQFSYAFTAPLWTPDAAGMFIGLSLVSLLWAAGRLVLRR